MSLQVTLFDGYEQYIHNNKNLPDCQLAGTVAVVYTGHPAKPERMYRVVKIGGELHLCSFNTAVSKGKSPETTVMMYSVNVFQRLVNMIRLIFTSVLEDDKKLIQQALNSESRFVRWKIWGRDQALVVNSINGEPKIYLH